MDEWKEGIWIAVSTIIVSVFLMFMSVLGMAVRDSSRIEQANMNNVEVLKEYYKIGAYDDVIVKQSDVINCIFSYRDKYDVYATSTAPAAIMSYEKSGNYTAVTYDCKWDSSTPDTEYTLDKIKARLKINDETQEDPEYRALLSRDENGAVDKIQFIRLN